MPASCQGLLGSTLASGLTPPFPAALLAISGADAKLAAKAAAAAAEAVAAPAP
eukprot:CAMPEP_0168454036 /NCGR_PEP_ID=MMETSP0228-20121227/50005_1 /TAXON_ID=133427 /ORGANISM="Protoceratium reticulatum, Strain CCCM 535 (=CCMP 1889)" /LENGTH=52 /DNA_ID=CAMNT_0008468793 /DNA_START=165 /DNA_END=320 /DNA_ORIENTATION=+